VFIIGAIGGYLGGIVGAGIGATIVPSLVLLGIDPRAIIGSVLLVQVLASPVGGIIHYRFSGMRPRVLYPLLVGGLTGIAAGVVLSVHLPKELVSILVGAFAIIAGVLVLGAFPKNNHAKSLTPADIARKLRRPATHKIVLIGAGTGVVYGITGGAWGTLGVPLLILTGVYPRVAVSTSLLARPIIATVGAYGYFVSGAISLDITVPLLIGALLSIILGAITFGRIHRTQIKQIIGMTTLILGLAVIGKVIT
jgi:hypothetical protein